jgi:hypothetical protein
MFLLCVAVLAGLGIGYLRGGRWQALDSLGVRWPLLPAVALALQMILAVPALRGLGGARPALLVVSYLLVGAWIWVNALLRHDGLRRGLILAAEGWLLNVFVMVANDGMPVSRWALTAVGKGGIVVSQGQLWKHVPLTAGTRVPLLGDVIPIPVPLLRSVISIGDVVMLAGLAIAAAAAMTAAGRRVRRDVRVLAQPAGALR